MRTVRVDASRSYDIHIGPGLLAEAGERIKPLCPGGTCCVMPVATDGMALGARSPNAAGDLVDDPSTVRVRLCEFADPDAAMTYFRPNDPADPEDDELFETGR